MQAGYFKTAWNDVKNSEGWFGKLLLLSLIAFIPIFGAIVIAGYLYGWARDIAWGMRGPLPKHIFGNEDGKLYSRGFFVLVIGFVFALLPWIIEFVWAFVMGFGSLTFGHSYGYSGGSFVFGGFVSLIFVALTVVTAFAAMLFSWVGSMRMSVYGRLSAGFQFNKMWAMIRHDFGGLMRIFGMFVLLTVIVSAVISILFTIIIFVTVFIGVAVTGGNLRADYVDGTVIGWILAFGGFAIVGSLLVSYVTMVVSMFIGALVIRSLGYWTRQFDVPAWRGQDDPMPFELHAAAARQAQQPYQPPRQAAGQGYGQPYQPQGQSYQPQGQPQPSGPYGQPYQPVPPQGAGAPQQGYAQPDAYSQGGEPAQSGFAPSSDAGGEPSDFSGSGNPTGFAK